MKIEDIQTGMPWPPEAEYDRIRQMRKNRELFEGKHEKVFGDAWSRLRPDDYGAKYMLVLNFYKRMTTLFADLLLGETPGLTTGDSGSAEQQHLDRIVDENDFWNTAYEVALDVPAYGSGVFKARLENGKAIIDSVQPLHWFKITDPTNIKEILAHVIAFQYEIDEREYLSFEIHQRGRIITRTYRKSGDMIGTLLEEEELPTGVDYFLVVPVQNLLTSYRLYGKDDYEDLDSVISEITLRLAQISRILDKHADPNMYGPDAALSQDLETGEWTPPTGGHYFSVPAEGVTPGYMTWEGNLESAYKQIEVLIEQLYLLSETSPAAFGQLKTGLAESGTALRRLMMAPLARVNRMRARFDPALKEILWVASLLEVSARRQGAVELDSITINWRDGLPDDEKEQTEIYTQAVTGGIMSQETAVKNYQHLDDEGLTSEMERIQAQQEMPLPASTQFLFGEDEEE